jgi:hypothetical protein
MAVSDAWEVPGMGRTVIKAVRSSFFPGGWNRCARPALVTFCMAVRSAFVTCLEAGLPSQAVH